MPIKPRETLREISNADLEDKLIRLDEKLDLMTVRTEELITAYNTAKGITAFIKWLAGFGTVVGIIWSAVHTGKITL